MRTKMDKSIELSTLYGVNATVPVCYFCNEPKNELILVGRIRDKKGNSDVEAPRNAVWDREPCKTCAERMEQGIILISVKDGESGHNPYRTGGWVVVREAAFEQVFKGEIVEQVKRSRIAFVPDEVWDKVGLPQHDLENS